MTFGTTLVADTGLNSGLRGEWQAIKTTLNANFNLKYVLNVQSLPRNNTFRLGYEKVS